MRWSTIAVVALASVASACHGSHSIYIDPGKRTQSDKPARGKAAKADKPATTPHSTEPSAGPGT